MGAARVRFRGEGLKPYDSVNLKKGDVLEAVKSSPQIHFPSEDGGENYTTTDCKTLIVLKKVTHFTAFISYHRQKLLGEFLLSDGTVVHGIWSNHWKLKK